MNTQAVLSTGFPKRPEQEWIEPLPEATPEELITHLKPKLTSIARTLHGKIARWNPAVDPDDIEQELALSILQQKPGYSIPELLKIATRDAIDFLLSKRSQQSYRGKFQHLSLEKMMSDGFEIDMDGNLYANSHNWDSETQTAKEKQSE